MIARSIKITNYRPFALLEEVRLGPLATIAGKNDSGKSSILRALQLFLNDKSKLEYTDIHKLAHTGSQVSIEVSFTSLPSQVEFEEGVQTTFQEEMLLDLDSCLRIRKSFSTDDLSKYQVILLVNDFSDDRFAGLIPLKEKELNERCRILGIDVTKSGRGITNKSKRDAIRNRAQDASIPLSMREIPVILKDEFWKILFTLLPEMVLFETDTKLGVGETSFQSQFRPIVKNAAENTDVIQARSVFTGAITQALQTEVDIIFEQFKLYTDDFQSLTVHPLFSWDKAFSLDIFGRDNQGIDNSLDKRGSGFRRLLMVSFFQYLAKKEPTVGENFIFAVEEPENCLHPKLQRDLVHSFRKLADEGHQVIVSTHSPVFAGASPINDLALITRISGVANAIQIPALDLSRIAIELGVEPTDQITGYHACIFVEGPDDILFLKCVAETLKGTGQLDSSFDDHNIGFIISGGDNLKHWIDLRAMSSLNRRFAVIVDSDRKSPAHSIPQRKLNWKVKCEQQGGKFFILRKREIENYLHPDAIVRSGRTSAPFDDYSDMKSFFGPNVIKVIINMSSTEILSRDLYIENGITKHELVNIINELYALS